MTIDEAIAHAREKAKLKKQKYVRCPIRTKYNCKLCSQNPKCKECSEEHEQLAEWLEELKAYRTLDKTNFSDGYNKAIDDFESKLIMHFADWKLSNAPFNDDESDRTREIICETIENAIGGVEEIAEQLKAGVVDAGSI